MIKQRDGWLTAYEEEEINSNSGIGTQNLYLLLVPLDHVNIHFYPKAFKLMDSVRRIMVFRKHFSCCHDLKTGISP